MDYIHAELECFKFWRCGSPVKVLFNHSRSNDIVYVFV